MARLLPALLFAALASLPAAAEIKSPGNPTAINGLPAAAIQADVFGTGADGTVTINSGTTSVTREMDYANLTISGSGHLNITTGFPVRIAGILDLSQAPAGAIFAQGTFVYNGSAGNASGSTGGSVSATCFGDRSNAPASDCGTTGKNASTGAGTAGAGTGTQNYMLGGRGGAAGAGGSASGGGTAGGAAAAQSSAASFGSNLSITTIDPALAYFLGPGGPATIQTANAGAAGGSGAGDGTNTGGASGGSGAGGAPIRIFANTINRGASTAASAIAALGVNAGTSANSAGGNAGGGGGSGGGGGGWIHLVVGTLAGATATNALDVSGGNGAAGGNGTGTGVGGDGGQGGNCGAIDIINLSAGTYSHPITGDSAGSAGGTHSGTTGGTAGSGCNGKANL